MFGLFESFAGIIMISSTVMTLLLVPIVIPIKAIVVHTLGAEATSGSALMAIPLAYFGVGVAFTAVYVAMSRSGRGNMVKDGKNLFSTDENTSWLSAAGRPCISVWRRWWVPMLRGILRAGPCGGWR